MGDGDPKIDELYKKIAKLEAEVERLRENSAFIINELLVECHKLRADLTALQARIDEAEPGWSALYDRKGGPIQALKKGYYTTDWTDEVMRPVRILRDEESEG